MALLFRVLLRRRMNAAHPTIAITATTPTTSPPIFALDRPFLLGSYRGGVDSGPTVGLAVSLLEQKSLMIAFSAFSAPGFGSPGEVTACQIEKVSVSWFTLRYADVRKERPRIGRSFSLIS